jgi:hypothetical protein
MSWQEGCPCPSYHFPLSISHFQFPEGAKVLSVRQEQNIPAYAVKHKLLWRRE